MTSLSIRQMYGKELVEGGKADPLASSTMGRLQSRNDQYCITNEQRPLSILTGRYNDVLSHWRRSVGALPKGRQMLCCLVPDRADGFSLKACVP